VKTPIQIGENLLNTFEMQKAIDAKAAEYYMPDVQRIGGVTGWLRAAAVAHAHNLDMSSHLFPEFSAHLLGVTPTCHWLEYMDWANAVLQQPFEVKNWRPADSGPSGRWHRVERRGRQALRSTITPRQWRETARLRPN